MVDIERLRGIAETLDWLSEEHNSRIMYELSVELEAMADTAEASPKD